MLEPESKTPLYTRSIIQVIGPYYRGKIDCPAPERGDARGRCPHRCLSFPGPGGGLRPLARPGVGSCYVVGRCCSAVVCSCFAELERCEQPAVAWSYLGQRRAFYRSMRELRRPTTRYHPKSFLMDDAICRLKRAPPGFSIFWSGDMIDFTKN